MGITRYTDNGIQIFYDKDLPSQLRYEKNKNSREVDFGDLIAIVSDSSTANNYYYEQMPNLDLIKSNVWIENQNAFEIDFNITSINSSRPGIYTIVVLLQSPSNALFPATSYPILIN